MPDNFQEFIKSERTRLNGERKAIVAQQQELEKKLTGIDRELGAIGAYESARTARPAKNVAKTPRRAAGKRRAATGARRGSKRDALIKLITDNPAGLKRGEILEKMGLKGNKSGEMSVSNALTALTKGNQVTRRDGKYLVA